MCSDDIRKFGTREGLRTGDSFPSSHFRLSRHSPSLTFIYTAFPKCVELRRMEFVSMRGVGLHQERDLHLGTSMSLFSALLLPQLHLFYQL